VYFTPFATSGFNPLDNKGWLSGNLYYSNENTTSIANTKLYMTDYFGSAKDSTYTGLNGDFLYSNLYNAIYDFNIQNFFGGVNSTDALLIMQHFAHINLLEGIKLSAADVNGSNTVNSTDALFVMYRFVQLIDEFPVGDWILEPVITPLIIYNDTVATDLFGLCYGDVDASFINGGKRDGSEIEMTHDAEFAVSSYHKYIIPVKIKNEVEVAAISLEFKYPDELMNISSAILKQNQQELISYSREGTTRIAWADLSSLILNENEVLVELVIETKDLYFLKDAISIEIGSASELVGPDINLLEDIVLSTPLVSPQNHVKLCIF